MNESTIFKKLSDNFSPTHLEVINESHKHKEHSQSPNSGNSHFLIIITSDKLQGMSRLAGQRKICMIHWHASGDRYFQHPIVEICQIHIWKSIDLQ